MLDFLTSGCHESHFGKGLNIFDANIKSAISDSINRLLEEEEADKALKIKSLNNISGTKFEGEPTKTKLVISSTHGTFAGCAFYATAISGFVKRWQPMGRKYFLCNAAKSGWSCTGFYYWERLYWK